MTQKLAIILENLCSEGKWYEFGEKLVQETANDYQTCYEFAYNNIKNAHPITIVKVLKELIRYAERDPYDLIQFSEFKNPKPGYEDHRIAVRISYLQYLVKANMLENIESEMFSLITMDLSTENVQNLNTLAFEYYYRTKKYDEAVLYINDFCNIRSVAMASLQALHFFNFTKITQMKKFESIEDNQLKILISKLAANNTEYVKIDGIDSMLLDQKHKLTLLVSVIRESVSNRVPFDSFLKLLEISEDELILLLLKSFELELVKGVIDTEQRIFVVKGVIPKVLNKDEIRVYHDKIKRLHAKMNDVIEIINNN